MSALANLIKFAENQFTHLDATKINQIKTIGKDLYLVAQSLADSRHRTEALTNIEQAVFHILQAVAVDTTPAAPAKK